MPALWILPEPLLLASTSATRRALLVSAGLPVEMQASGVDERAVEDAAQGDALDPPALARRLAGEKASVVSRRHPKRIVQIRQNRLLSLRADDDTSYVDRDAVAEEIAASRRLFARNGWPIIDVTRRSIEETAAAILDLYRDHRMKFIAV